MKAKVYTYSIIFFCLFLGSGKALGQTLNTEFGKNRVQFHDDFKYYWNYESQNFIIYWYGKSRNIAESTVKLAEYDYGEIQKFLEHRINDKIEILVYTDITDMKQNNIGDDEVFLKEAGTTKITENKMFVYFTGNHLDLRKQIRQGIARIYLNEMLEGSALQEFVQNAIWMQLPDWYVEGIVSYVAHSWNEEIDEELRQAFWNEPFEDYFDFAQKYPRLAGHSLWHYISVKYGNTALSNLLYLTRINRQLESGFIYVLGVPYEEVVQESFQFYNELYKLQHNQFNPPVDNEFWIHKKRRRPRVSQVALSPDASKLIFITNEIGRYKVWLRDMETGDRKLIFKGSFRNPFQETDYDYPQVAWHPDGETYGIMWEKRDVVYFQEHNLRTGEKRKQKLAPQFYRVYNFKYLGGNRLIMSASVNGYSDIFIYYPNRRTFDRISRDFWDDLDPVPFTMNGEKGVLFASNRQDLGLSDEKVDSLLPIDNFDLFFYSLEKDVDSVRQVTFTEDFHERYPVVDGENQFQVLSNRNGIWNRWLGQVGEDGKAMLSPLSNRSVNINEFDAANGIAVENTEYGDDVQVYTFPYQGVQDVLPSIPYTAFAKGRRSNVSETSQDEDQKIAREEIEKEVAKQPEKEYRFQSEFPDELEPGLPEESGVDEPETDILSIPQFNPGASIKKKEVVDFESQRALAYRLHFTADELVTKLDNEPLFGGLNSYAGFKRGFDFPPVGILIKSRFKDVFEDYLFEVGVRIPTTFNGTEYYFIFDNVKYQLDKRFAFYRRSVRERDDRQFDNFDETRYITHIGIFELRYPLNIFSRLGLITTLRQDRYVFLAEEINSLNEPDIIQQRVGLRLEYVFDNTFDVQINIKNGTRAKFYVEAVNRFRVQFSPWEFDASEGFMTVIGFDARHYERIAKHSVLALRLAGATTFGSEKILYYMGGVDNWFGPQYNSSIPFPPDDDFAYQTVALNMRGFRQNIRNGSSYLLMNAELRMPLVNYFTNKKVRSGFLRSLQVVGFFDIGTAWHGSTPYSDDNPLNSVTVSNPVSIINAKYFRDPIVYGYGAGVRAQIFGYFLRLDYGWGVDTRQRLDPRLYVAMGTDF